MEKELIQHNIYHNKKRKEIRMGSYERKQLIYKFILGLVFVACLTAVITFYATSGIVGQSDFPKIREVGEDSKENINTIATSLKDFRKLIDQYYIGDIDEQKVMDETIKGYINGLDDEYSEYMTAEEWEEYQINTLGNYVGIGIYMAQDNNNNIVVVEPIEESPAAEVGLKAGDLIVEVDGENVTGQDSAMVSSKIKGQEGTSVNLKINRDSQYMDMNVERKAIKVYHVKNQMLENNVGYIKLATFDEGCSNEFQNAFEELQKQGAQKLILDLRDNTGGLVDEALNIADMMVPKDKTMLITKDAKENKEITTAKQEAIIDMDIVVLVNEYSASASEILVGCLKDNQEATVVGKTTYGKGVIQNVFSLSDGSVLKLTTAEYFTPNETKINKEGIKPDIEIDLIDEPEGQEEIDEQLNKALEVINQ